MTSIEQERAERIENLQQRLLHSGMSRRNVLKLVGALTATPIAASLLAACGGGDDDDTTPTTAAPATTATTAAPAATATSPAAASTPSAAAATTPTTAAAATATTAAPAVTATTAAPAGTPTTAASTEEQFLLDYTTSGEPRSHDLNADLYCNGVAEIWSGLIGYDADFTPIPDWAEKWETNADASVWTFSLRKDNKGYSNGDPVTAQAFIGSWLRLLDPATNGSYVFIVYDIKNAQAINAGTATPDTFGAKAIDDFTLELTMEGPRGAFAYTIAYTAAVPTHLASVEKYGPEFTDPGKTGAPVVSNGAWTLTKWDHNVDCELVKNPNYWQADTIKLDKITWKIIDATQGLLPYEAGDIDWQVVPAADLSRVKADATLSKELSNWVEPFIWTMLPSTTVAPFTDLKLRQALSHSIDRDRLNDLVDGANPPAYCLMPPGVFGYLGDDTDVTSIQTFDPEKAMAALVGTPQEGGKNWPDVTVIFRDQEQPINSQILLEDIVAQVAENIGLQMKIQTIDFQTFRDTLFKNEYQVAWIRWYFDYPDPNNGYYDMFYSDKPSGKRQSWSNADFDALTIKGKEVPQADRLAVYKQAEILMQNEVAYIPVTFRNAYDVFKPWMKGMPINKQGFQIPNGNIYLGMWNSVYIEGRQS